MDEQEREVEAYRVIEEAYRRRAVETIHDKEWALSLPGVGPKTYRKWVREAIETWHYARFMRRNIEKYGRTVAIMEHHFVWKHQLKDR